MVTNELLVFIRESLQGGMSPSQVGVLLKDKGWPEIDIQQGLEMVLGRAVSNENISIGGKLKGPLKLISESLQVFRAHLSPLLILGVLPTLFGALVQAVLDVFIYSIDSFPDTTRFGFVFLIGFGLFALGAITYIFWLVASSFALMEYVSHRSENLTIGLSYRRGLGRMLSGWKVYFLSSLVVAGAVTFFIIPGVILGVYFAFAIYFVFDAKAYGTNALIASKRLVSGYWWAVVGRQMAYGFLLVCVLLGVGIVVAVPLVAINSITGIAMNPVVDFIFNGLAAPFITVFSLIYSRMIYENLYALKGAVELSFTNGQKAKYWLVGLWGLVVAVLYIILMVVLIVFLAMDPGERFREAKMQSTESELHTIQTQLEFFYFENNGMYPVSLDELDGYEAGVFSFTYQVQADRGDYRLCYVGYEEDSICVTAEGDFGTSDLLN